VYRRSEDFGKRHRKTSRRAIRPGRFPRAGADHFPDPSLIISWATPALYSVTSQGRFREQGQPASLRKNPQKGRLYSTSGLESRPACALQFGGIIAAG
jgi:hypothetical protein